jgi:hypothetical protein
MMTKAKNTAEQIAKERAKTSHEMMDLVGATYDQWVWLVFDTGCLLVERYISQPFMQQYLLTDKAVKFWNWWLMEFMDDDAILFDDKFCIDYADYHQAKMELLTDKNQYARFNYFLMRNKLLNGKEIQN